MFQRNTTAALALALFAGTGLAQDELPVVDFDARAAEHLLNRAGFGATPAEIEAAVARGLEATVDRLFEGDLRVRDPFFAERCTSRNFDTERRRAEVVAMMGVDPRDMSEEARRDAYRDLRRRTNRDDQAQLADYTEWWLDGVLDGDDPLRDRMTLFWMGYFTSSMEDVRDSFEMIEQHTLLRENALGSFETLLRGIARDAAMLEYLDNDDNKSESPNENFARELLELFTLGEGHYSERDIVEAARAFTGWTDRRGVFRLRNRHHDRGEKTFLGQEGNFDGDDVLTILLGQSRTTEYVCERLLAFLEGDAPSAERVERYGALLSRSELDLTPVVRAILMDPEFYRDDVIGNRIAGPVDLLVGHARRIGVEPPARLVAAGSRVLGQRIFYPPNVKGWEGDEAWITTSTFMQRGNLAGVLLGEVAVGELLDDTVGEDAVADAMVQGEMMEADGAPGSGLRDRMREQVAARFADLPRDQALRDLGRTERIGWTPRFYLAARFDGRGAGSDAAVVDALFDELLAIDAGSATRAEVLDLFTAERTALDLPEGAWTEGGPDAERLLRRTAHVILSLPEAQLH